MGARFQTDIDGCLLQQRLVFGAHRSKSVHLSVSFTTAHMIAFTDDKAPSILPLKGEAISLTNDYGSHHRVRTGVLSSVLCQLNTAAHIFFIVKHIFILLTLRLRLEEFALL
jgi:hypothetical protein